MLDLGTLFGRIEIDTQNATSSLQDIRNNSDVSSGGILNLSSNIKKFVAGAATITAVTVAIKEVAEAIASCVNKALDLDKSLNNLQATTGVTDEEMAGLETSLKNIYANNYGEDFEDIANALSEVKTQTGLAGEELEKTTENALAMRDTFDMDVRESIRSVDMMMRQFGLTSDEAYNLIAQGAQNGLNKNDNLLDSVNEYSVHFSQLGFSAEEMFNMFSNGAQTGVFDIDKLGDAVKEFGIRTKDGSKTTIEAFEILNLNADEMQEKFAQGGEVANEAFKEVITALNNCDNEVAKTTAGVNLFGTMWEDLGGEAINALTNTNGAISITADNLEKIKEIKYDDFGSAIEGIGRQLEVGIMIPIGEKILPILNNFANWINEQMPKIQLVFQNVSNAISVAIDFIVGGIKRFIEACNDTNTNVGAIWNSIKDIIVSVLDYIKTLTEAFIQQVKAIWSLFGDEILFVIKKSWDNICIVVETVLKTIKNTINIVTNLIKGDWSAVWESVKKLFSDIWQGILNLITTFLDSIYNVAVEILTKISNKWTEIWTGVKNTIVEIWTSICNWFSEKINDILTILHSIKDKIYNTAKEVFTRLWEGYKNIWKSIYKWLKEIIATIVDTIKSIKDKMYDAGKEIFTSMWNGIKSIWESISSWVEDKVSWLIDKVSFWKSESSKMDSSNVNGSHRTGLRSVPFDDYRAILHKGEMVLTQPEAERYRQGNTNINNQNNPTIVQNFYNVKEEKTAFQMKREVKKLMKDLKQA